MPHLLLIENDLVLRRTLHDLFTGNGHTCSVAGDPEEAEAALIAGPIDLVVLDAGGLPSNGMGVLQAIRAQHHTPILMLAPGKEVFDTVEGLTLGADDYLCEPFDPREVMARAEAQLRRAGEYRDPSPAKRQFDLGGIVLDVERRDAFRDGRPLQLTPREFDLLHLLARHAGQALSSAWIIEHLWSYRVTPHSKALAVHIGRLRGKIEADRSRPRRLLSLRGFGYRLVNPDSGGAPLTEAPAR
jgi:DNA-binding response OmpR family regulator